MKTDAYGQMIFSESDLVNFFYKNPESTLQNVLVDQPIRFDSSLDIDNIPQLIEYHASKLSVNEFDLELQNEWMMPEQYKTMDIAKWVLEQCTSDAEMQRAGQELLMYQERNMFILLKYLKYLVDTMRQHNIVWGVGRGSSVASFVLFLIGIHRINSLFFDLSIEEFLK